MASVQRLVMSFKRRSNGPALVAPMFLKYSCRMVILAASQIRSNFIRHPLTLERITAERVDLYSYVPSPVDNIPVTVKPVEVDDLVPTEDKIEEAVK